MAEVSIHGTALVSPDAHLGEGVVVGPYAIVEAGVSIGAGSTLDAHAVVRSGTSLGARCRVHPFAVLGGDPQDKRYAGEPTRLLIGNENVFREHVTVHRGTTQGGGTTRIGHGGLFMAGAHVAHDADVGDGVTLANGTLLAGHVTLEEGVVTGGGVAIAPFVRIGARSFLAGGAMVEHRIPPFVIAAGDRARVRALNRVGLERAGVPEASRSALSRVFRVIFRGPLPRARAAETFLEDTDPFVRRLAAFCCAE